jgi:hypothetical protein
MIITMKKVTKLSYALAVAVVLSTSCNKLDEFNPSQTNPDDLWKTPEGFMTLVNGVYRDIHNFYGVEDGMLMGESGTDLWFNAAKASFANELTRHEGMTPLQNTIKNGWAYAWSGINLCNNGISRIDQVPFADQNEKKKRLAELRFMRALYYWHIVEQFGGVMLNTEPTTTAVLTATRHKPEEFYDLIISDLLFAKDNLPINWGTNAATSEYGRASKKSAMGLLARVYLTRAYYSNGAEATDYFTKARDMAMDVINNKTALGCDLYATPADLWNPANNELNKECLFAVTYSLTNSSVSYNGSNGNKLYAWYQMKYTDKPGMTEDVTYGRDKEQRLMPTWHLLDLFDETKDARYEATFQEMWKANAKYTWKATDTGANGTYWKDPSLFNKNMAIGDTAMVITKGVLDNKSIRKYVSMDRNDTYDNPQPGKPAKLNADANKYKYFVSVKKFADPNRPSVSTAGGFNDFFAIRFAEMYMIAAEAYFQLGDNASAATQINVLRTRAAKPGQAAAMQISASDVTLNFILDERAREFCGEQLRYYDLKRVFRGNDFAAYISFYNPDITAVQAYHRLRPVPQSEMDVMLNAAEFGQNEGYSK